MTHSVLLGDCFAKRSKVDGINFALRAIENDPSDRELYVQFAKISFDDKSFPAGVRMVTHGIEHNPLAAELYMTRGVLEAQTGATESAAADFARAELLDPKQASARQAEALSPVQRGTLHHATLLAERAVALDAKNQLAHDLLANLLLQQKDLPGRSRIAARPSS